MASSDKRKEPRQKVALTAEATDLDQSFSTKCLIRDISKNGCRIYCDDLKIIPNDFLLKPSGFEKYVKGTIVWRKEKWAGVRVDWDNTDE